MKRKAGKIIALMLAAAMMLGTVTVGAEELEAIELTDDLQDVTALETSPEEEDIILNDAGAFDENAAFDAADSSVIADDEADKAVDQTDKAKKISSDAKKVFQKIAGGKKSPAYKALSKKEKKLYDSIDKEVKRILYDGGNLSKGYYREVSTRTVYQGKNNPELFEKVNRVYKMNNPQAFFLYELTGPLKTNNTCTMYYTIGKDCNSTAKIRDRGNNVAANLKKAAQEVKKGKNDYQKAVNIMNLLCKRLKHGGFGEYTGKTGLLATFYKNRKSAGNMDYAITFTALARLSGLEACEVPGGYSTGGFYCGDWNRVKVKGKWYNVDLERADWRDGSKIVDYNPDYFLKNDGTINKDKNHFVEKKYKKYLPSTNSKNYNLPKK
ncbi:MAG: hypothetical protein IKQ40_01360 [Lachnospiraceae bacterium]|nr:hypothetical protein [Lachnospiraceae bacterium]